MSKMVRALVIGFIVAAIVGFAVSMLNQATPGTEPMNPVFWGCLAGAFAAFILGNLAGNRRIANASRVDRDAALNRTAPPGKALLYVYRTGFVARLAGLNIAIDGRPVAQLKAPRFTLITVPARPIMLTATFGGLAGPQTKKGELTVDASAGGIYVVKITIAMGLAQGKVQMQLKANGQTARSALASYAMTPADAAEI
jgi:hypothetical protein